MFHGTIRSASQRYGCDNGVRRSWIAVPPACSSLYHHAAEKGQIMWSEAEFQTVRADL